jgi:hypothetical protein
MEIGYRGRKPATGERRFREGELLGRKTKG